MKKTALNSLLLQLVYLLVNHPTFASVAQNIACFNFKNLNTPAAQDMRFLEISSADLHTWCYQKRLSANGNSILIFNLDSPTLKPELSALVYLDQNENPMKMSIGSLLLGKTDFHELSELELNPFPVPLSAEAATRVAQRSLASIDVDPNSLEDLAVAHSVQAVPGNPTLVTAGDFNSNVSVASEPFNGFWWSNEGVPMATGGNSPLGVYDAYVAARTGKNPNSVSWEESHHSDTSNSWGGHCNGWSASSVLYPEPTHTLYDTLTQKMITPYAQKGMLAEAAYCLNDAFYGTRYTGPTSDIHDIYPDLFHEVLSYYISTLGKPVAMDYERGIEIDNNVITGYHFHIVQTNADSSKKTFHVDATLTVAQYDVEQRDSLGKADTYEKSYAYTLTTDLSGKILNGAWDATSDNPDFLWVPLSMAEACSPRNPKILPSQVDAVLNLPAAKSNAKAVNFSINSTLSPQDQSAIPLTMNAADQMNLSITVNSIAPAQHSDLVLIVSGDARYPVTGGEKESMFIQIPSGTNSVAFDRLLSIDSIAVVNQSKTVSYQVNMNINTLQYLGP
jgi:hypothetical protein